MTTSFPGADSSGAPAVFMSRTDGTCRNTRDDRSGWNIVCHDSARAHHCVGPHSDTGQDDRACSDEHSSLENCPTTQHRQRTQRRVIPDERIVPDNRVGIDEDLAPHRRIRLDSHAGHDDATRADRDPGLEGRTGVPEKCGGRAVGSGKTVQALAYLRVRNTDGEIGVEFSQPSVFAYHIENRTRSCIEKSDDPMAPPLPVDVVHQSRQLARKTTCPEHDECAPPGAEHRFDPAQRRHCRKRFYSAQLGRRSRRGELRRLFSCHRNGQCVAAHGIRGQADPPHRFVQAVRRL